MFCGHRILCDHQQQRIMRIYLHLYTGSGLPGGALLLCGAHAPGGGQAPRGRCAVPAHPGAHPDRSRPPPGLCSDTPQQIVPHIVVILSNLPYLKPCLHQYRSSYSTVIWGRRSTSNHLHSQDYAQLAGVREAGLCCPGGAAAAARVSDDLPSCGARRRDI